MRSTGRTSTTPDRLWAARNHHRHRRRAGLARQTRHHRSAVPRSTWVSPSRSRRRPEKPRPATRGSRHPAAERRTATRRRDGLAPPSMLSGRRRDSANQARPPSLSRAGELRQRAAEQEEHEHGQRVVPDVSWPQGPADPVTAVLAAKATMPSATGTSMLMLRWDAGRAGTGKKQPCKETATPAACQRRTPSAASAPSRGHVAGAGAEIGQARRTSSPASCKKPATSQRQSMTRAACRRASPAQPGRAGAARQPARPRPARSTARVFGRPDDPCDLACAPLTEASRTPGTARKASSTVSRQVAQCMPSRSPHATPSGHWRHPGAG